MIVKLQAYGFDKDSLNVICNYLLGREQKIKINSYFSTWSKTEYGAPQGSILRPLLFSLNTLDMFFGHKDFNFAAYTDDNTQYFCDKNLEVLLSKLQISALKLLQWFSDNYIKTNFDKCHLIFSSNDENKKIQLNNRLITSRYSYWLQIEVWYTHWNSM